ncbi:MAG: HIT domain-containing protein, partial [Parasporobacterium sp.]|nr:HIT domain-containing protein [Parasporobacterium sp.]
MKDDNCIFCKLANGDIPTTTLYEDPDFRVIFDASPATVGHALILPKEHYANVFEMPEELLAKAYVVAKKVGTVLTEVFQADGLNILQNNHEAAGQSVF